MPLRPPTQPCGHAREQHEREVEPALPRVALAEVAMKHGSDSEKSIIRYSRLRR